MKTMFTYIQEYKQDYPRVYIAHEGIEWNRLLCDYALEPLGDSIE